MKIHAVGGYDEVGKNMTALQYGEDVILFDAGIYLPAVVGVAEREKIPTEKGMRNLGALPDDTYLEEKNLRDKVRAIVVSHAHLDHIGALPYIAPRYKCPVLGTPYSIEVMKVLMKDNNQSIPNRLIPVRLGSSYKIKGKSAEYLIEMINITHSTIESAIVAVHTPEGVVLYANDYKLDNSPILGQKPDYNKLKFLAKKGVKALIVDCLYAPDDRKTPSEKIARSLLEDVMFNKIDRNSGIVVTTFSSHIARLSTISEFGKKLRREVVFVGRSLAKYTQAAKNIGKGQFTKEVRVFTYKRQVEKALERINKNKNRYLLVCTGHQGEPGSILDRISRNQFNFKLSNQDNVVFSSKTIPTPQNEESRRQLEERLNKFHPKIYDNIHVSGHGGREDLRDLIKLTAPQHVIPSHGDLSKTTAGAKLAVEMGYVMDKTVHLMSNGSLLNLQ